MIFGACYYPEQWNPKDWDEDLKNMKEMGLSSVRLAEFAWGLMEPKEGKFDFSLFDAVLKKLQEHGMTAILGTPTATFPPWLYKKFPEIVQVSKEGIIRGIGTRRQACFSSPAYKKATERIVTAMAKHFGNHPAVVGWQIDNEPGHEGSDVDYSPLAQKNFRTWLKNKYKTLDSLNKRWGNIFWGVIYTDWNEIPLPAAHVASNFNPAMIQDYYRFQSDELVSYIHFQAEILRKYSKGKPLTTNLYPSPFLPITDMTELFSKLDYVSWDNYPVWGNQQEPYPHPLVTATQQYSRGLKNKPYTVMEQFSGVQGHDTLGYLPPPGQIGLWLTQAIVNGANQIYFFRYRTARFGQEQLCYGILDHGKRKTSKYFELKKTIEDISEFANDIADSPYKAEVTILHDIENSRNYKHQPLSDGLKFSPVPFAQVGYDIELATWFAGTNVLNVNSHSLPISADTDWSNYKVLTLPLYTMFDPSIVEKLKNYVAGGGTLVLGYRAGIKDKDHWMVEEPVPGVFGEMAGVEVFQFEAPATDKVGIRMGILPLKGSKFCEILEPTTAKVIARYNDSKKFYSGKPAITVNTFGKGKVYYVGTSLTPESFILLYRKILKEAGVSFGFLGATIERHHREGKQYNYEITMNHSNRYKLAGLSILKPFGYKIKRIPK
ncbi:beta-galactosidase [Leptospira meyeri]|uniref:beta-galactosidase n=1 Tax=Leptospira meyeri TaxID=29508 RepID=UPI000C2AB77D|nr:beta-galactosidase [Leptospira meyeri]MCW7488417.1 beta-galactosidase [Leptospira meyeri]PJZ79724.1 beta-galactosidase [Leptospira meyeri]PJZ95256.1 beta-galactosidase [Leptospira meyeri]TGL15128.1 beta-galactosidase [Leptospira meyeri]TGM64072.1 beta-galactosidase [Leptospira meyeri]